jgi:hypothetical protein
VIVPMVPRWRRPTSFHNQRRFIDGVTWRLLAKTAGISWNHFPHDGGNMHTIKGRYERWVVDNRWNKFYLYVLDNKHRLPPARVDLFRRIMLMASEDRIRIIEGRAEGRLKPVLPVSDGVINI